MQVKLKLFASLGRYLPTGAVRNIASLDIAEGTTVQALLDSHNVPPESCHLVLVNGIYQAPEARSETKLTEGDELAVWPPVAGG